MCDHIVSKVTDLRCYGKLQRFGLGEKVRITGRVAPNFLLTKGRRSNTYSHHHHNKMNLNAGIAWEVGQQGMPFADGQTWVQGLINDRLKIVVS